MVSHTQQRHTELWRFFTFHLNEWYKHTPKCQGKIRIYPWLFCSCLLLSQDLFSPWVLPSHESRPRPRPGALQGEHPLLPTRNLVFTVTAIKEPRFYSSVAFPLYLDKIPAPCPRGCTAPGPEPRWLPWLSGRSPLMRRGSGCISTQFPPSSFPAPGPGILTTPPTVPIANLFSFTATFDVHSTRVGRPFPVSLPGRRANPTKVLGIRAPQGPLLRPPLPHCGCQTSLSPPALLLTVTPQPRC